MPGSATAPFSAFVVAGTHSGAGKTSVTLGVIGALRRRGLAVQPFKVGPDFIDPLHHRAASGRTALNLDGWLLDADANRAAFARASADADVAVIEGMMGLFDGSDARTDRGSTAELAKLLDLPVVLVVDAGAMARSVAALVHGFASFDPALRIAGVVLNNVGGPGHTQLLREALDGVAPVLGGLPRDPAVTIAERHLGLHLPGEVAAARLERLADLVVAELDLNALLAGARRPRPAAPGAPLRAASVPGPAPRIAVARDAAFCFVYADNLRLLEEAGAEIVPWSPLAEPLPEGSDGVYVPGGYPELHAAALAANCAARASLRRFAEAGGPVYAECGGLMYLGETLEVDGCAHAMCGALPLATRIPAGLTIGYLEVTTEGGLFGPGSTARGHVFHHAELVAEPPLDRVHRLRTVGGAESREGYATGNVLASWVHLHFGSCPTLAPALVERCRDWRAAQPA